MIAVGQAPFDWFTRDPRRGRLPVRGRVRRRLARDRLGRDGRAGEALGLLRLRRLLHADLLGRLALDLEPARLAVLRRACRTSPARPSCTTRARSRRSPGRSCSGRGSASSARTAGRTRSRATTCPYAVLGTIILWFGWFGFNPGSTLSVDFGGFGYFAYVAMTTNIAAAAGRARRHRHRLARPQEARHLDDAERRDRSARRDHRGLRASSRRGRRS